MNFRNRLVSTTLLLVLIQCSGARSQSSTPSTVNVAVGPQYDTTHVYVSPKDVDAFVASFLGTFGGTSTKQVVATVTPTVSSTSSQLLQTPVGTISLFGFTTPIPTHFGDERNGYLTMDLTAALVAAQRAGADIVVAPFPDPIGLDAVIQWPGGVNMQLYWHTKAPSYAPFRHIPENRVYVSPVRAESFIHAFLAFSNGKVISDETNAPGIDLGRPGTSYDRVRVESTFGKMVVFVTDGQLPYPYGRETTGYEVDDLNATLAKGKRLGVQVIIEPHSSEHRLSSIVIFPGGYVAELHSELHD